MRTREGDSTRDRDARRAVLVEGLPVAVLGGATLALGSDPARTDEVDWLWFALSVLFVVSVAVVLVRNFRRGDEYQRKVQLESMAVAFAAVLLALQVAMLLDAVGVGSLRLAVPLIGFGGILVWLTVADLRTRLPR